MHHNGQEQKTKKGGVHATSIGCYLHISIVLYNTEIELLKETFNALSKAVTALKTECPTTEVRINLIDNSTNMPEVEARTQISEALLSEHASDLTHVGGHGNVGYGSAHNKILNNLSGPIPDYFLIMNPDIIVDPNALIEGIRYMGSNPDVSAINPLAVDAHGGNLHICKNHPSVLALLARAVGILGGFASIRKVLDTYELRCLSDNSRCKDIPLLSGCFMLCRAQRLREVGGFDSKYFLYFEDFDLSIRLDRGGRLAFVPGMKVIHLGGFASRKGSRHFIYFVTSAFKYFNTYGWRWIS